MKNIKFILSFVALGFLSSCDNYFEINDVNPNAVQLEDVPPRLMLPGAMAQTFRTQATTMNALGSILTNAWAGNVNSFASPYSREYKLQVDNSFYSGIWDGLYRSMANFELITKYPNADHSQDQFVAVAKIMKSYYMQYIVDLYGKAPYSEAFQYQENLYPKYDNDFEIYKALVQNLDDARAIMNGLTGTELGLGSSDIMMGGDLNEWYNFANTLELRMLLRMRSSNYPGVAAYVASRVPGLVGQSFISTDVTINPGYDGSADDKQNPFFNAYVFSPTLAAQNRTLVVASGHIARILNGGNTPVNNVVTADPAYAKYTPLNSTGAAVDQRGARMFFRIGTPAKVRGVLQGSSTSDTQGAGTTQVSRLGFGITKYPYTSNSLTANPVYKPSMEWASAQSGVIMLAAESYFLQAEAAVFLDAGFGFAQGLFDQGITASYDYYSTVGNPFGIAAINPAAYIAAANTIVGVGFGAATNDAERLEAIMYQKWMALHSLHGIEPFIEYTRTGYPSTPLAIGAEQANKPKRLNYPVSEYVANSANVPALSTSQLFTVNSTSPFWLQ
ncbi:SusD/RagB family nutrient-binding outer membrane lipoprotein [Flavobacterium terrigena]|uniref:Starch-binding associating with outer membrane n=1 Tax=Flavobacterium terrigena TaxID=402734 RepID=A0A1H6RY38_9FLAO|nr:SusD/RagB family nutrient-binding outer membrane lipoprotein [Flavobacterium terrigena]SEI60888.1 Starch-binding associating with outer membrane [Flavobacterium terrigena]